MNNKHILYLSAILLSGCNNSQAQTTLWKMSQLSDQGHYIVHLDCATLPTVGAFQECQLRIESQGTPTDALEIEISGGMPAHGHGLPTSPVAIKVQKDLYRIEGLKYSMSGEWVLGFLLKTPQQIDKVAYRFSLP